MRRRVVPLALLALAAAAVAATADRLAAAAAPVTVEVPGSDGRAFTVTVPEGWTTTSLILFQNGSASIAVHPATESVATAEEALARLTAPNARDGYAPGTVRKLGVPAGEVTWHEALHTPRPFIGVLASRQGLFVVNSRDRSRHPGLREAVLVVFWSLTPLAKEPATPPAAHVVRAPGTTRGFDVEIPEGWSFTGRLALARGETSIFVQPAEEQLLTLEGVFAATAEDYRAPDVARRRLTLPAGQALFAAAPGAEQPHFAAVETGGKFFVVRSRARPGTPEFTQEFLAVLRSIRRASSP